MRTKKQQPKSIHFAQSAALLDTFHHLLSNLPEWNAILMNCWLCCGTFFAPLITSADSRFWIVSDGGYPRRTYWQQVHVDGSPAAITFSTTKPKVSLVGHYFRLNFPLSFFLSCSFLFFGDRPSTLGMFHSKCHECLYLVNSEQLDGFNGRHSADFISAVEIWILISFGFLFRLILLNGTRRRDAIFEPSRLWWFLAFMWRASFVVARVAAVPVWIVSIKIVNVLLFSIQEIKRGHLTLLSYEMAILLSRPTSIAGNFSCFTGGKILCLFPLAFLNQAKKADASFCTRSRLFHPIYPCKWYLYTTLTSLDASG